MEALFDIPLEDDTGRNLKTPDTHNGLFGDMAVYDITSKRSAFPWSRWMTTIDGIRFK